METQNFLNAELLPARTHQQQMKVLLRLPVRLMAENKTVDILPIPQEDLPLRLRRKSTRKPYYESMIFPSLDEVIVFFKDCAVGSLTTRDQVAQYYGVTERCINTWSSKGILKRYRLLPGFSVYKLAELPTPEEIYGTPLQ